MRIPWKRKGNTLRVLGSGEQFVRNAANLCDCMTNGCQENLIGKLIRFIKIGAVARNPTQNLDIGRFLGVAQLIQQNTRQFPVVRE